MSIELKRVESSETWDQCVERSPGTTPFHQESGLKLLGEYADATVHRLIGYNGQEPIGLLPLFETEEEWLTVVRSPPRLLESFSLGPAHLNLEKMSQRKTERYRREFVDSSIAWLDENIHPEFVHIRTAVQYSDVRPFTWNRFAGAPYYTYVIDLTQGPETVKDDFSQVVRSNLRDAKEMDCEVEEGGIKEVTFIMRQVRRRLAEQGERSTIPHGFVEDIYGRFPDGQVRPYICRVNGETVSGIIFLEYGDTIYAWQGAVQSKTNVPTTDVLYWRVIRDSIERGLERYDLVGANIPRLCEYKTKFGPVPSVYFNLNRRQGRASVQHGTREALRQTVTKARSTTIYKQIRGKLNYR